MLRYPVFGSTRSFYSSFAFDFKRILPLHNANAKRSQRILDGQAEKGSLWTIRLRFAPPLRPLLAAGTRGSFLATRTTGSNGGAVHSFRNVCNAHGVDSLKAGWQWS